MTSTDMHPSLQRLCRELVSAHPDVARSVAARVQVLRATLDPDQRPHGVEAASPDLHHSLLELETLLTGLPLDRETCWLVLTVLGGRMPERGQVTRALRLAELEGTAAVLADVLERLDPDEDTPVPRVVRDAVLVDVHHTAGFGFATGIQRVARESVRRWRRDHDPLLIGWTLGFTAMRSLTPHEARRACEGGPEIAPSDEAPDVIVPWRCTYVLPELAAEIERARNLQVLAEDSGTSLNMIGFDLVPITTAETSHEGLVPGFAQNLAAARSARVIAPIAEGAADEYRGWRSMLGASGLTGPDITPVVLPAEAAEPGDLASAAARLRVGGEPLVLVVGSHEPRKNHEAVLFAAERLWQEGLRFSLTFIGGNSWNSTAFVAELRRLQDAGRPVESISAASDHLLWAGYRLARFTVFPSLNEGFGLPVAESLSVGTPVVTSGFGTMKEIVDGGGGGGALLVDPRDDDSIADAMRHLLTDQPLLERLRREAALRVPRTWDDYAAETWAALTGARSD